MPSNIGSQSVHTKFFDPLINQNTNFMALDIRKPGIYSGGYLSQVGQSNTSVSLSPLSCEILDAGSTGNQVRVTTGAAVTITVGTSTPLVVLRWTYTGSATVDYMDFKAIAAGAQLATDLVVGTCTFAGSTLTGFDYSGSTNTYSRSDAFVYDLFLKPEPATTYPYAASLGVILRSGVVSYGISGYSIPTQVVTGFTLPATQGLSMVHLIQITTAGAIILTYGTQGSSPTPPQYNNLVTIAEVTVQNASGTATITAIKDVRSFVNSGITLNGLLPSQAGYSGYYLESNGTNPIWNLININTLLPSQSGYSGDFLATTGSNPYWTPVTIDGLLPSETGKSGYLLTTNGISAGWILLVPPQAGSSGLSLITNGSTTSWGNATYA